MTVRAPRRVACVHLKPAAGVIDVVHIIDADAPPDEVMVTTVCGVEIPWDALTTTTGHPHLACVDALDEIRRRAEELPTLASTPTRLA